MNPQTYIAADLGASSGKTVQATFNGKLLELKDFRSFKNQPINLNTALYWNTFGIYQSLLDSISYYASKNNNLISFGIDTWGASYGLLDYSGRLLEPIYHYRDQRSVNSMEEMTKIMDRKEIFDNSGCQPNRTYTLPQLFSYSQSNNKILDLAKNLLFLPDLVNYFLTGEISTEKTIAGTSALFDVDKDCWSKNIINKFSFPSNIFTSLTSCGTEKGVITSANAEALNCGQMKVISSIGHDSASAVAAIPNFGTEKLYISVGTNISMGVEVHECNLSIEAFESGFKNTNGFGDTKILYRDFSAGWLVNEFKRITSLEGKNYTFDELESMSENSTNTKSFFDIELPQFNSANRNIKQEINKYLQFTNQEILNDDSSFINCIYRSIALKINYYADCLKNKLGIPLNEVYIINGGAQNRILVQMISDALQKEVYVGLPYASLAGNVLTQLYAQKEVNSLNEMRSVSANSFQMKTVAPKNNDKYWQDYLGKILN
jgi:sugar (pentulose or hexulose) kinase